MITKQKREANAPTVTMYPTFLCVIPKLQRVILSHLVSGKIRSFQAGISTKIIITKQVLIYLLLIISQLTGMMTGIHFGTISMVNAVETFQGLHPSF